MAKRKSNPKDSDGRSRLVLAVKRGDADEAKRLLENGADPDARMNDDTGDNTWYWACRDGNMRILELLLRHGGEINCECHGGGGGTPLDVAIGYEHFQVAQYLLRKGADVNRRDPSGATPLHTAALRKDPKYAELLISNHARVNVKDDYGKTPLTMAIGKNNHAVVALLRSHGASVNLAEDEDNKEAKLAEDEKSDEEKSDEDEDDEDFSDEDFDDEDDDEIKDDDDLLRDEDFDDEDDDDEDDDDEDFDDDDDDDKGDDESDDDKDEPSFGGLAPLVYKQCPSCGAKLTVYAVKCRFCKATL